MREMVWGMQGEDISALRLSLDERMLRRLFSLAGCTADIRALRLEAQDQRPKPGPGPLRLPGTSLPPLINPRPPPQVTPLNIDFDIDP